MTKKQRPKLSSEVLTEHDKADLRGAVDVLCSLLEDGSADPDAIRFVGYLMVSLADRFEQKAR